MSVLINNFTMGADPEFAAFNSDGFLINCSKLDVKNAKESGGIGYDHSGDVGELRPRPSKSVSKLLGNIKTLIESKYLQDLEADRLVGGSLVVWRKRAPYKEKRPIYEYNGYGYYSQPKLLRYEIVEVPVGGMMREEITLGGHIHFGIKPWRTSANDFQDESYGKKDFTDMDEDYTYSEYTASHGKRMRAMDRFTYALEGLGILPDSKKRRDKHGYGHYGQFRGSDNKTEYRTMCSWLFSPLVADLCLTGVKLIAHDPDLALITLPKGATFSEIRAFISRYATKDEDANRVTELLSGGQSKLTFDVTKDFRPRWEEVSYGA